jgi:hypothetical protein
VITGATLPRGGGNPAGEYEAWCGDVLRRRCRPSTTEYNEDDDDDGTIHRTLSEAMRAAVLAETALAGDVEVPPSIDASLCPRPRWTGPVGVRTDYRTRMEACRSTS